MTKPKRPDKQPIEGQRIDVESYNKAYNQCHTDHDEYIQYLEQSVKDEPKTDEHFKKYLKDM